MNKRTKRTSEEATRRRRKRKRGMTANRAAMPAILLVVGILCLVLAVKGFSLKKQINANDQEKEKLEEQIREEESRTDEIEALRDYYESDEYIRQVAQDKLGLVEDGQIVFRSAD